MTNRTDAPAAHRPTGSAPPGGDRSIRRASVVAGAGLLLMVPLAVFGNFVVLEGLVTPGDAAQTADDIMASESLFRLGVASWVAVVILDVVVAWALGRVFAPVSTSLSTLAAWLRLAYAALLMVAVGQLVGIPKLLDGDGYPAGFTQDQLNAQALSRVDAFNDMWSLGLLLFGVNLLVVGYLAFRSGYVPKLLGLLVLVAGAGYALDSTVAVLSPDALPGVGAVTFVGEPLLAIWLVVRGRRVTLDELPTFPAAATEVTT